MRYILERTHKAEIRLEEQTGKVESCQENLWIERLSMMFVLSKARLLRTVRLNSPTET